MTLAAGAELRRHILHHLGVKRLVHGDEDAAHQQGCDQILGADFELLRQIFHADAFGDGDLARDGHRLVAVLHAAVTWRRHKALHRAFFGLRILLLSTAAAARACALRARRSVRRRSAARAWPCAAKAGASAKSWTRAEAGPSAGSWPGRPGANPPGVERVGCLGRGPPANCPGPPGPLDRAGRGAESRSGCGPAIEDWLAALQSAGPAPGAGAAGGNKRCLVDRPRSCLRHHHAARRRRGRQLGACWRWAQRVDAAAIRNRLGALRRDGPAGAAGCGSPQARYRTAEAAGGRGWRRRARRRFGDWPDSRLREAVLRAGRSHGRLHDDCGRRRRDHNHGARGGNSARRLGDHGACRRRQAIAGASGGGAIMGGAERGCGTILRGSGGRRAAAGCGSGRGSCSCGCCCTAGLAAAARPASPARGLARLFFLFLLLGEDRLHHIAGFGDMRQIDFGNNGLRAMARRRRASVLRRRVPLKVRANLFRLVPFKRAGVRLPVRPRRAPEERRESREILTSSSFARSLIRTLLIRLFSIMCCQSALSRS